MNDLRKSNIFAIVGGALLCLSIFCYYIFYISNDYDIGTFMTVLWIADIGFAVTLFLRNKIAVLCSYSLLSMVHLYDIIERFEYFEYFDNSYKISSLLRFLLVVSMVVIILLSLLNNKTVKYIWFIPFAFGILQFSMSFIPSVEYIFDSFSVFCDYFIWLFMDIPVYLFVGLWAASSIKPKTQQPYNANNINYQYQNYNQNQNINFGIQNELEQLNRLYQSGSISIQEYEYRKNQILNRR